MDISCRDRFCTKEFSNKRIMKLKTRVLYLIYIYIILQLAVIFDDIGPASININCDVSYFPFHRLAVTAMKQLHPDVIANIQSKTLFSKGEETLLGKVTSVSYNGKGVR